MDESSDITGVDGITGDCSICLSTLETGNLSTTPCNHSFHFTCLLQSMNTSNNCPNCRLPMGPEESEETETDVIELQEGSAVTIDMDLGELGGMGDEADLRREIMCGILHSTCRDGNLDSVRRIVGENPQLLYSKGDSGDLLTHEAVLSDKDSLVSYLLNDQGMNPNLPNDVRTYPLHYAVLSGSVRMVTLLVNKGAFIDCTNDSKSTPLMLACEEDDPEMTQFLLDRGASTRTQDSCGNYPLHVAVKSKSYTCVRKLLGGEADVDTCNYLRDTPLHIAVKLGFYTVSRVLLEEGADPEAKNRFDVSPTEEATSNGSTRLRNLLHRYVD